MDNPEPQKVPLRLDRVLINVAPPKTAHHILITRIGEEFTVEIGYIEPTEMRAEMEKAKSNPEAGMELQLLVFDRYTMNRENFVRACKNMQAIAPTATEED